MYFSRVNSVVPRVFWVYQYIKLLCTWVDINSILSHKIPKNTITMVFTFTDNTQFYGLQVFLRNILMIVLFRSNNRMVSFSKTEKNSYHSKHVRHHTFMMSTWIKGRRSFIIITCLQIFFVFKDLLFIFADEGVGGYTIGHLLLTSQMFDP